MNRVGEHPVNAGPLAPRWLSWAAKEQRAGATSIVHVVVENAGTATWRSIGAAGVRAAFHWLDRLGNPIVWDGPRTPLLHPVAPGEQVELTLRVTAPRPPGAYRLSFDFVEEHRFWFEEVGCTPLSIDIDVAPRIAARRLAVLVHGGDDPLTTTALATQDEAIVTEDETAVAHLIAGAVPPPGWSRLVLDAHEEGWEAVGVAITSSQRDRRLQPWRGGGGRNPRFAHPLLLPSLIDGAERDEHLGLPAYVGREGLFDGRLAITLPRQSDRRPG